MKYLPLICLFVLCCFFGNSQSAQQEPTMRLVDSINRQIDQAVIDKDIDYLEKHYTDDFVFTHGTGKVDSKESWLKGVMDTSTHYILRKHDSTSVELHNKISIVRGKLSVQRQSDKNITSYSLKYVRVYVFRQKRWQLLSHYTTMEWH